VRKKLIGAAALGLCTAGALFAYTTAVRREAEGGGRTGVLVALRDVEAGEKLSRSDVGVRAIPSSYVHPDAVPGDDAERALGRPVASELRAGQPILWRDLRTGPPPPKPLAERVPRGQRALTLPVDVSSSLGGALRAGDRVDLLGTFTRAGEGDRTTVTLLQDVAVLDAGASAEGGGIDHLTVALDLEEAELVTFALLRGQIQVVLRHARDGEVAEQVPDKSFADIFEAERRNALMHRHTIEQIGGREP
jgi:pilus assembly protein CpaB